MKLLTTLILLLSLVLPVGMVSRAVAAPGQPLCAVVDDSGCACCNPASSRCCCDVSPGDEPAAPQPLPLPASSAAAKDIAASLPHLLVLAELPRLSGSPAGFSLFSDRALMATAPPVRLCVLRCSLLL